MKERLYRQVAPGRFAPIEEKPAGQRILNRLPKLLQRVIDFIRSPKTHMAIAALFIVVSGFFFISQPVPVRSDSRGNQQVDISAFLCNLLNLLVLWICVAVVCRAASFIFGKREIQTTEAETAKRND